MRSFLLALLLLGKISSIIGQQNDVLFSRYYSRSMDKLRQLYQSRGISDGGCVDMELLQAGTPVDYRGHIRFALEKNYGRLSAKIGLLFYSVSADTLSIWFLKDTVLTAHHQRITTAALTGMEAELRKALRVEMLAAGRSPVKRGAIVGQTTSPKKLDLQISIRKVSGILLPPPISSQLHGIEHLMIAPEFNIGQFPFYLLQPWGNNAALLDSFSISFTPHLCNLLTLDEEENELAYELEPDPQKATQRGMPRSFSSSAPLIVGNPEYSTFLSYTLPPLPGAEEEARQAAAMLHTTALTGKKATLSTIKELSEKSDLLYFATHGVADPENPLEGSFLAFAPDATNDKGIWTARDIQDSRLHASLAILSACQTGVGQIHAGGFIGLGRAFYIARVRNTVMSLWSVDDRSTARLMRYFLESLKTKDNFYPANHLRRAILRFRKEDTDPAHWAPFVIFGFPE